MRIICFSVLLFLCFAKVFCQSELLSNLEAKIRDATITYLEEGKYDYARAFYKKKAAEPGASAIVKSRLAYLYLRGLGGPTSVEKAKLLLEDALTQITHESKMPLIMSICLSEVYNGRYGFIPGDKEKVTKYIKLTWKNMKVQSSANLLDLTASMEFSLFKDYYSCINNDPFLQEQLSMMIDAFKFPPLLYIKALAFKAGKWTFKENKDSSYHYYQELVEMNYPFGITGYANHLWGDEKYEEAYNLIIGLARKKNYSAIVHAVSFYIDPLGPYKDLDKARFWYNKAIEKGNYDVNINLMHTYEYEIRKLDRADKLDTLLQLGKQGIDNGVYGVCEYMAWAIKNIKGEYDDEAIEYARIGAENGYADALITYSFATREWGSTQRSDLNEIFRKRSEYSPNPRVLAAWGKLVERQIYHDDFKFHPSLYRTPLSYYEQATRCGIESENAQKNYDDLYAWLRDEKYLRYVK
ncbi:MAG: hypothetical protein AAGA64_14810 [Bacteroidota bacterium]